MASPEMNGSKTKRGRVQKVVIVDKSGEKTELESKQIPQDTVDGEMYKSTGLKKPPFDLEHLIWLSEMHPVHAACLEQRASDVIGGGWRWEQIRPDAAVNPDVGGETPALPSGGEPPGRKPEDGRQRELEPTRTGSRARANDGFEFALRKEHTVNDEERDQVSEAFESLSGEMSTMLEILHQVWLDYETCGQGYLEVARDEAGKVGRVYHVPAHTIRIHGDGERYAQQRGRQFVWFVEWGSELKIDSETGEPIVDGEGSGEEANELLVFRKPTQRSAHYGIPNYVSAIGWIMLALSSRDYNIQFFQNLREPRWAIILSNLEGDEETEEMLQEAFTVDLSQPHRNLMASFEGDAKVNFQKLSEDQQDGSFTNLLAMCDRAILVAHRMPSDRLGLTVTGPLGGNVAEAANRVYREGVVLPAQEVINHRLNLFIRKEIGETNFKLKMVELDTKAEKNDLTGATLGWRAGIYALNEARARAGLSPVDGDIGGQFIWNIGGQFNPAAIKSAEGNPENEVTNALLEKMELIDRALRNIEPTE